MAKRAVTYQGKTYESFSELGRQVGTDGIHVWRLVHAYGWNIDDAVKACQIKGYGKLYEYEGKRYRSIETMAEDLSLPYSSLQHCINRCDSVEEAIEICRDRWENRITLWGKYYRNKQEICEAFGIKYANLKTELEVKQRTLEEAVLELLKRQPIKFEGAYYSSITELCCKYQIQPRIVYDRLQRGKTLYDAVYQPLRPNGKVFEITFEGKQFTNATELCRFYNISRECVAEQCRYEKSKTFIECFALVKQLKDEIGWPEDQLFAYIPACKINGVFYKTMEEFVVNNGMSSGQITTYKYRRNCKDWIETLKGMKTAGKPGYQTETGIYSYKELERRGYKAAQISQLPYRPTGIPLYPSLQKYDFENNCIDIRLRYKQLFGKEKKRKKQKPIER